MTTLAIRQATPDDTTALARLLDPVDGLGATPEQVAARLLACSQVVTTLIGEVAGQPVGFACLRLDHHRLPQRGRAGGLSRAGQIAKYL